MRNSEINLADGRDDTSEEFPAGIAYMASSQSERMLILPAKAAPRAKLRARPNVEPIIRQQAWSQEFACRSLDIAGSLALIIFLFPMMVLLAIAVAITSGTFPIFAHTRVGKGGQAFKCYKFRSMYPGAEQRLARLLDEYPALRREWERDHKLANDPRITPLGQILRVTSMDEIPQLFNVLFGDMSLVGPRPVVSAELARYGRFKSSYLKMKPGITGMWQISGRSDATYRRRVAIDRLYARRKSLILDCKILIATVPAVLTRRGAC